MNWFYRKRDYTISAEGVILLLDGMQGFRIDEGASGKWDLIALVGEQEYLLKSFDSHNQAWLYLCRLMRL